jgi:hypothetical protein
MKDTVSEFSFNASLNTALVKVKVLDWKLVPQLEEPNLPTSPIRNSGASNLKNFNWLPRSPR